MTKTDKDKLIEESVVALNGEWPNDAQGSLSPSPRLEKQILHNGGIRFGIMRPSVYLQRDVDYTIKVCSYDEFIDYRDKMINKPSWDEPPSGAKVLVYCSISKAWLFGSFSDCTRITNGNWMGKGSGVWFSNYANSGVFFGNALRSIEFKPKEAGNIDQFDELPPVGTYCETLDESNNTWYKCVVIKEHASNPRIMKVALPDEDRMFWSELFRPIDDERDRVIASVRKRLGEYPATLDKLYEIGALRIPNEKCWLGEEHVD